MSGTSAGFVPRSLSKAASGSAASPGAAPRYSILRQAIAAVLLIELAAACVLTTASAAYEQHTRAHAFDVMLQGRAAALLGAVQDADDADDNVMLNRTGIRTEKDELFSVAEENGRVLGRSPGWPAPAGLLDEALRNGAPRNGSHRSDFHDVRLPGLLPKGEHYRFVAVHGVRVVDPEEANGGKPHAIVVWFGAPTRELREAAWDDLRFDAVTFGLVLLLTASFLALFLRRALAPLGELAAAADRVSAASWNFAPPHRARLTRELAPLTAAIHSSVARLQQSAEQQRRFTSDAAHELKTDVAIIKSSLQLLTMRPRSEEHYRTGLTVVLEDCERLEDTVQEMLTLARVEHAGTCAEVHQGPAADLPEQARRVIRALTPMAELRGVRLELEPAVCRPVAVSAKDCELLCTNILENALEHSPRSTVVQVTFSLKGSLVHMDICDQGHGVPPEMIPHVFEAFFRVDDARDRRGGGTGLGLAICKAICDKASGSVSLASEPGRGTLVSVRLPMAPGA